MTSSRALNWVFRLWLGATVIALVAYGGVPAARAGQPSAVPQSGITGLSVALSTTAAGVSGVTYTLGFTASATGALAAGTGTVTLAAPTGTQFPAGVVVSGSATFDDLTSGTSVTERYFTNDPVNSGGTLTLVVPINIAAGDRVKMTYTDVTNAAAAGPQTLTLTTSSDTQPATTGITLTAAQPVAAFDDLSISTAAAGASNATYTFEFTASATGDMLADDSTITLSGPATMGFFAGVVISGSSRSLMADNHPRPVHQRQNRQRARL